MARVQENNLRAASYIGIMLLLSLLYFLLRGSTMHSDVEHHTLTEMMSAMLAFFVGIVALVRFYSKKSNAILLLGVGFLGTSLLDIYHVIVTSQSFSAYWPSPPPSLSPWSWYASRVYLSILMLLSYLAWRREAKSGISETISEKSVYLVTEILALACFLFFAFYPLPPAYYPEYAISRPGELISATFFLLALIGYLTKGRWKWDSFEHMLVISLIAGFMSQALFMSTSTELYDTMFTSAHVLKNFSYICVLIALLGGMYRLFKQAEDSKTRIEKSNEVLRLEISERHRVEKELRSSKDFVEGIFNSIHDPVSVIDPHTLKILAVNKAFLDWVHLEEEDVVGRICYQITHGWEKPPDSGCPLQMVLDTGQSWTVERQNYFRGTREHFVEVLTAPIMNENGEIDRVIHIAHDITARKLVEQKLLKREEQYKEIISKQKRTEQMKDEFVSVVSHDMRTPLTSIHGAMELISKGRAGELPDQAKQLVDIAARNSHRLNMLIDDILDIQRIESGRMEFDFKPQDLRSIIEQSLEENKSYADQFEVSFVLADAPQDLKVAADSDRIMQVMANLLSNAAKFSPPDSAVEVSIARNDDSARVMVKDHGPGIPEGFRTKIFQKFSQADPSVRRKRGGTGLGLNIARSIVEAHGGKIDFESELNVGTTFYFDLPEWQG